MLKILQSILLLMQGTITKKVIKGDKFLVWTTTPWCIPGKFSNCYRKRYRIFKNFQLKITFYWIASDRLFEMSDYEVEVLETSIGKDLIGASYIPAYSEYEHLFKDGAFFV